MFSFQKYESGILLLGRSLKCSKKTFQIIKPRTLWPGPVERDKARFEINTPRGPPDPKSSHLLSPNPNNYSPHHPLELHLPSCSSHRPMLLVFPALHLPSLQIR